jgi:hypothetical protein
VTQPVLSLLGAAASTGELDGVMVSSLL